MIGFIRRRWPVVLWFIGLVALGNKYEFAALTMLVVGLLVLLKARRHSTVLLFLLLVMFFGDNRELALAVVKDFRYPVVVILALVSFVVGRKRWLEPEVLVLLPFIVVSLFGLHYHGDKVQMGLLKTLSYVALALAGFQYVRPAIAEQTRDGLRDIHHLLDLLLLAGLLLIPIAPDIVFLANTGRYRGLLGNPNGLGAFCVLALPLHVYLCDRVYPGQARQKFLSVLLIGISLVLSASRTATAGVLVFALFYTLTRARHMTKAVTFGVALPLVIVAIAGFSVERTIEELRLERLVREETLPDAGGRVFAWDYAKQYVADSPAIGHGFYFDEWIFEPANPAYRNLRWHQGAVHNTYLSVVLNAGYVGLGLFLVYLGFLYSLAWKWSKRDLLPFIIAIVLATFFESWLAASLNAFTILFYLNLAVMRRPVPSAEQGRPVRQARSLAEVSAA